MGFVEMFNIFARVAGVFISTLLIANHSGVCASYDYSNYKVCDDEYVTYKSSALRVSVFVEDLNARQKQGETLEFIKASTGFILDEGFNYLIDALKSAEFLPDLKLLDLSFNRISGSVLKNEGFIEKLTSLLGRKNFEFLDMRANPLVSFPLSIKFFSQLSPSSLTKIIWINEHHMQGMRWINSLSELKGAEIMSIVSEIKCRHEKYFRNNQRYRSEFELVVSESPSATPEKPFAISNWNNFVDSIEGGDFATNIVKEFAKSSKDAQVLDQNRLELGKRCYEGTDEIKMDKEKALCVFSTLAESSGVFPPIKGEAFYYLSKIYREKDMFEKAEECYDEAYDLGYKRGW